MKKTKRISKQVYDRKLLLAITNEQHRKLSEMANGARCSLAAIVRLLISEAK